MTVIHRSISALLLVAHSYRAWAHVAPLDRRETDVVALPVLKPRSVELNTYDYVPANGPLNWQEFPGNEKCGEGTSQSPIMLDSEIDQTPAGSLSYIANKTEGEVENRGSGIDVTGAAGTLKLASKTYRLANYHFHTPSEHRLDKEYYPVEMHMVHQDSSNTTVVIGFLVQLSTTRTTGMIRNTLAKINQVPPGQTLGTGEVDFGEIVEHVHTQRFYQYWGSLTAPPCRESIRWLVATKPLFIDVDTYNNLKGAVKFNSRITQNMPGQQNVLVNDTQEVVPR